MRFRSLVLLAIPLIAIVLGGCKPTSGANAALRDGMSQFNSGDWEAAKHSFTDALRQYEEIEGPEAIYGQLLALMNVGGVYLAEANYASALDYTERAVKVYREWRGDRPVKVTIAGVASLSSAGVIYNNIGYHENAYACQKEALETFNKCFNSIKWKPKGVAILIHINHTRFRVHFNYGVSSRNIGQYKRAQNYFQKALKDCKAIAHSTAIKDGTLSQLAITYLQSGDIEELSRLLGQIKKPLTRGLVNLQKKDYRLALSDFLDALNDEDVKRNKELLFSVHTGLGLAYEAIQNYEASRRHLSKAISLSEEIRTSLPKELDDKFITSQVHGFTRKEAFDAIERIPNE